MSKPRPREFQDDLLITLATLSGGDAEKAIPFKSTWDPVCKAKGITIDEYGTRDDGKFWVALWILGAFRALKDEGLTVQIGRGKWGITEDGIAKVGALLGTPVGVAAVDDDSAPAPDPVVGMSIAVGPGLDDTGYHPDPYIRALAADSTPCFGRFTSHSTTCSTCSLSGSCRNMVASTLSVLAEKLRLADEEAAKKAATLRDAQGQKLGAASTVTTTAPASSAPKPPAGGWDNTGATKIVNYTTATCYRCGKDIERDEECYWTRPDASRPSGLFHLGCF